MKRIILFCMAFCGLFSIIPSFGQSPLTILRGDTLFFENGNYIILANNTTTTSTNTIQSTTIVVSNDTIVPVTESVGFPLIEYAPTNSSEYGDDSPYRLPIFRDSLIIEGPVPDDSDLPAIPYSYDVTHSGAYVYNVPIDVFPGINGMQPSLALTYNSQGGNSIVGYGWDLSGISCITMRSKNMYYDGKVEGICQAQLKATDFALTLDGQKLISVKEYDLPDGKTVEYKLEASSMLKVVVRYNTSTFNLYILKSATVYYPDGKVAEYTQNKGNVLLALSKVTDKNGNEITYKYIDDSSSLRLDCIDYGGNSRAGKPHFAKVGFSYKTRNDKNTIYEAGYSFVNNTLLSDINVYYAGTLLRTYSLSYTQWHYSQLTSILLKSNNVSYAPLTLRYQGESNYNITINRFTPQPYLPNATNENSTYFSCRYFENNPKDAVVVWPKKKSYQITGSIICLSDFPEYTANDNIYIYSTNTNNTRRSIPMGNYFRTAFSADLEGIGRDKLVKVNTTASLFPSEQLTFTIYDSSPDVQPVERKYTIPKTIPMQLPVPTNIVVPRLYFAGDFDGDGKQEIFAANAFDLYDQVAGTASYAGGYIFDLNNHTAPAVEVGSSFELYKKGDYIFVADYNGDGKHDIIHISKATGLLSVYSFVRANTGGHWSYKMELISQTATPYRGEAYAFAGDINGDGKTDILQLTGSTNYGNFTQFLSKGDGSFEQSAYTITYISLNSKFILADFNNDGRSDLIIVGDKKMYYYYSDGTRISTVGSRSAASEHLVKEGFISALDNTIPAIDRILVHVYNNMVTKIGFDIDEQKNALLQSSDCKGITVKAEYGRWDRPETVLQMQGNLTSLNFPYQIFNEPLWVTTNVLSEQLNTRNTYSYADPVMHKQGLGFCGFSKIERIDIRENSFTKHFNPLEFGIPLSEENPTDKTTYDYRTERLPDKSLKMQLDNVIYQDKLKGVTVNMAYEYDSYGNPTKITQTYPDNISETTAISYDNVTATNQWFVGLQRKVAVTKKRANAIWPTETTFAYDTCYNPTVIISTVGQPANVVSSKYLGYDPVGNLTSQSERLYNSPTALHTSLSYSPHGQVVYRNDERNNRIEYEYDNKGRIKSETAYNSVVLAQIHSSKDSFKTRYSYDAFNRVTKGSYYNGLAERKFSCFTNPESANGSQVIIEETGKPAREIYTDVLGQLIKKRSKTFDNSWLTETLQYDMYGRIIKTVSPAGETVYAYDGYDRLLSVEEPTGGQTTYVYNGLNTTETKNNYASTTSFNALGEVVQIIRPDGTINYTLRPDGQTQSINAGGIVTSFEYDNYGRQTKLIDPSAGTLQYEYDESGHLAKQTNAKGEITFMTYNVFGLLSAKQTPEYTANYIYRLDGTLLSETNGLHSMACSYDKYNRLVGVSETIGYKEFATKYEYAGTQLTKVRYPTLDYEVDYQYNNQGFTTAITGQNTDGIIAQKTIEQTGPSENGLVRTFKFNNRIHETHTYDRYGQQVKFNVQPYKRDPLNPFLLNLSEEPDGDPYFETYSYDTEKGLLAERNHNVRIDPLLFLSMSPGTSLPDKISEEFTYDTHQRLTGYGPSSRYSGNPNGNGVGRPAYKNISYAGNGNITQKTGVGAFRYNGSKPYAITAAGAIDSTDFTPIVQDIQYNSSMQPTYIGEGDYRAYFDYGADGQRCRMELYENNDDNIKLFTRYYFAGGRFEETDYEECYAYAPTDGLTGIGIIELTPGVGMSKDPLGINFPRPDRQNAYYHDRILYVDGSPYNATIAYTPDRANKHFYIHRDRQGSVRHITNAEGAMVAHYYYDPWGRQTDMAGNVYAPYKEPLLLLGRGYTGHEHLPWFNAINMNARLYDPILGRFLSPDPYVQNPFSLQNYNRYSYCLNNPLLYFDPSGAMMNQPYEGEDEDDDYANNGWKDQNGNAKTFQLEAAYCVAYRSNNTGGGGGYGWGFGGWPSGAGGSGGNGYGNSDGHIGGGSSSGRGGGYNDNVRFPKWTWSSYYAGMNQYGEDFRNGVVDMINRIADGDMMYMLELVNPSSYMGCQTVELRNSRSTTSAYDLGYSTMEFITAAALLKMASKNVSSNVAAKGGLQYSDDLLKAAQQAYPKLAGKTQLHHITPKYLGGPANGPLIKLDAAYHQQITNEFRKYWGYGQGIIKDPVLRQQIMDKVYSVYPLPK